MKFMRRLRSLTARMVLSHIIVATLTSILATLLLVSVVAYVIQNGSTQNYRAFATIGVAQWQLGAPDGLPNAESLPAGFAMVVSPENTVLYTYGDTKCRAGMKLADCAPTLLDSPLGERFFDKDGQRWFEFVLKTVTGQRSITQYALPKTELSLVLGDFVIHSTLSFILIVAGVMIVLSIPLSLVLGWFWARPLARRVGAIAKVSQRVAAGDLEMRVRDRRNDEVGELARQFDDMTDTLEQNVHILRDLAQRNAELAQQTEQMAVQAERIRLSRDLHDDIAQQLFSLSVSAAALPGQIERDQLQGVQQARAIAGLAEKTLLDLRGLLVELRPSTILQKGLPEALHELCNQWQATHNIPIECTLMLTGERIPAGIEDVLYRVTQEALHNIFKHAQASEVHLGLVEGMRQLTLSITDNGTGFDPAQVRNQGKFGLVNMRERVNAVGGNMVIESDTQRGTTLRLTLPLEREAGVLV